MKIILLILSLVAVSTAVPSAKDHWNSFKREHGKAYESPSEEQMRFTIFMDNLKMIEEHNAKYEAGLVSYHLKMNMFGDLRLEEAYALFNGFNKTGKLKERNQDTLTLSYEPEEDLYLPSSMDWRQKGAVTPVKDQGQCGGCWAFSTTGAMEGQLFKKTGKLVSLSEQQLIDCSDEDSGCGGGLMDNAFNYLQYSGGLASEQEYPFTGKDGECQFSESSAVRGTSVLRIVDISKGNEQALKKAVATAGPVSIAVSAGNPGFLYYGGGVFYGETCNPSALDHGILAVGYGTQNGQDYWIVKNSWGPTWGEQGYIRLARNNDNTCGIASMASYPIL